MKSENKSSALDRREREQPRVGTLHTVLWKLGMWFWFPREQVSSARPFRPFLWSLRDSPFFINHCNRLICRVDREIANWFPPSEVYCRLDGNWKRDRLEGKSYLKYFMTTRIKIKERFIREELNFVYNNNLTHSEILLPCKKKKNNLTILNDLTPLDDAVRITFLPHPYPVCKWSVIEHMFQSFSTFITERRGEI